MKEAPLEPTTASKKVAKESERRQVTIVFADISGFTSMSEKMDPEEVTSVMNDCFAILGKAITDHGGTIDKFMGDCVMSVFGAPVAIEDAPKRAINAAIEMRSKLHQFSKRESLSISLGIHFGINSGEVISGAIGSAGKKEFTVMGDAVNLASRLEELSEEGQILVGQSTYQETRDYFAFKQLDPVSLKGKEKPVPIYELLSRRTVKDRARVSTERMIFSEMVKAP